MNSLIYFSAIVLIISQLINTATSASLELDDEIEKIIFERSNSITDNSNYKRAKRWGIANQRRVWPNGIINYKISCQEFTPDELILIRSALNEIENRTCIRFNQYELSDQSVENFIDVQCIPHGKCKAQVGFQGGKQNLNLDRTPKIIQKEYCVNYRKIQHEFLHALGFKHEHNSPNRDEYIKILWDNVRPGGESYFSVDTPQMDMSYGCLFDYNSVMSVPSNRQTKNGQATIEPLDPKYTSETIGIALSISDCDIIRLKTMYCNNLIAEEKQNQNAFHGGQPNGGQFIAGQPVRGGFQRQRNPNNFNNFGQNNRNFN